MSVNWFNIILITGICTVYANVQPINTIGHNVKQFTKLQRKSFGTENASDINIVNRALRRNQKFATDDGDPYLYPCSSDDQCPYWTCHMTPSYEPETWFCDCTWGSVPCTANEYCCNNLCVNGACSSTGGQQGTVCSSQQTCADNFECVPWGDYGYYPYLNSCTNQSQCPYGPCHTSPAGQKNMWVCDCWWGDDPFYCTANEQCCTNICNNGTCSTTGGVQGTVCNDSHQNCASGYTCQPWGDFGYCNLNSNF